MSQFKVLAFKVMSVLFFSFAFALPVAAVAEGKSKMSGSAASASMTPEKKKDMAEMYQKMADCMRTEKSMPDCHKEVMKDCPVAKATGHCPIMEGMMGKGAMKHGKMDGMNMEHPEVKK